MFADSGTLCQFDAHHLIE